MLLTSLTDIAMKLFKSYVYMGIVIYIWKNHKIISKLCMNICSYICRQGYEIMPELCIKASSKVLKLFQSYI